MNRLLRQKSVRIYALGKNCNLKGNGTTCQFLRTYRDQIFQEDINQTLHMLESIGDYAKRILQFDDEPHIVLIVYEDPKNPCSERTAIHEYFNSNGVECHELEYPIK